MSSRANALLSWLNQALCGALLALLWVWKRACSPLLGSHCRFHPTCSEYAADAVRMHGAVRGTFLAGRRLLRCNSLTPGGLDPVPPAAAGRERH